MLSRGIIEYKTLYYIKSSKYKNGQKLYLTNFVRNRIPAGLVFESFFFFLLWLLFRFRFYRNNILRDLLEFKFLVLVFWKEKKHEMRVLNAAGF